MGRGTFRPPDQENRFAPVKANYPVGRTDQTVGKSDNDPSRAVGNHDHTTNKNYYCSNRSVGKSHS